MIGDGALNANPGTCDPRPDWPIWASIVRACPLPGPANPRIPYSHLKP